MMTLFWILHSSSGYRAEEPDRVAISNYALWCVRPNTSATNEAPQFIPSPCFKHRWVPEERIAHSSATLLLLSTAAKLCGPQWEHCWEDPTQRMQCWQHVKCSTLIGFGTLSFPTQEFYWLYITALLQPCRHLYPLNTSTWAGAKPKDNLEPVPDLRKSCRLIYAYNQDFRVYRHIIVFTEALRRSESGILKWKGGVGVGVSQFSCIPLL